MVFPTFAAWAATHGKVYNGDEIVTREAIYNANVVKIEEHNEAKREWTMDVNVFADLEEDEFLAQYTGASPPPPSDQPSFEVEYSDEVADAVDWVQKGFVNPIKDQGKCGSCWAFSTMGVVESGHAIATGNLVSVSEQQLVDCDGSNDGCSGGWPHTAFSHYLKFRVGVCSESSYPYTGRDGSCSLSSCSIAIAKDVVTGYTNVGMSSAGLKSALSEQPVSVTVNAAQLQFYGNGVVTGTCSGQINHAVIAVGYGTDGTDYFNIRNSWGTGWGESGYIRLGQNGGSQGTACLYQYAPVTPRLSSDPPRPAPTPVPAPSGSCAAVGCGNYSDEGQCDCDSECFQAGPSTPGRCCSDFMTSCLAHSCASDAFGCGTTVNQQDDPLPCKCDANCRRNGNCCSDFVAECRGCEWWWCGPYSDDLPCQCDSKCRDHGNCCPDYGTRCHGSNETTLV